MRNLIKKILKEDQKKDMLYTEKDVDNMIKAGIKFYWMDDDIISKTDNVVSDKNGDIYYLRDTISICWEEIEPKRKSCYTYSNPEGILTSLNNKMLVPTNMFDDINFDNLYESSNDNVNQEDSLQWAQDIVSDAPIKIGDVFYIVDTNSGENTHTDDYRPEDTRYVIVITGMEDGKTIWIKFKECDPNNVTYRKEDYIEESNRCSKYKSNDRGESNSVKYNTALELIKLKFWRRM